MDSEDDSGSDLLSKIFNMKDSGIDSVMDSDCLGWILGRIFYGGSWS